jgi:hypothetical protein
MIKKLGAATLSENHKNFQFFTHKIQSFQIEQVFPGMWESPPLDHWVFLQAEWRFS